MSMTPPKPVYKRGNVALVLFPHSTLSALGLSEFDALSGCATRALLLEIRHRIVATDGVTHPFEPVCPAFPHRRQNH
jgi:hypothetical protein